MKGEVFTGEGKASEFLQIEEYNQFIQEETGFEPFPGTLNLRADPGEIEQLKKRSEVSKLESFEKDDQEFGGLKIFPVTVEGINSCVIVPELTRYGDNVIELCSPVKLRSELDLEDGDEVNIYPKT